MTQSLGGQVEPRPPEPRTSAVERTLTVLLMIGLGILVPITSFMGLLFGMVSDGCAGDASLCNEDQIGQGILIASGSPVFVFITAFVVVAKRFRQGRPAWWVPLVALAVGAGLFVLGGVVAATAVK